MARSQDVNRRYCARVSLMRICVILEVAVILIMLTAFVGNLVIKHMLNEGVRPSKP